jgi:hypothetical protein
LDVLYKVSDKGMEGTHRTDCAQNIINR